MTDAERLVDIQRTLDRVERDMRYLVDTAKDHETRVRSLERWKLSLPISLILILVSALGVMVGKGGL